MVQRLDATSAPEIVDVLHESFYDYPVMRFVLGPGTPRYAERLRTLVHFCVMARVLRNEVVLGVRSGQQLLATALISRPGGSGAPPELQALRTETWTALGGDAERRYSAFATACGPFQVAEPHLHLNMIGVRNGARGSGLARRLLDAVHAMSRTDPESTGVTLTTEDPSNVSLYKYFGYEVVGEAAVGPGLNSWGFYRTDPA
jgi:ribosomal protein S18 acetylase RimI-like enzyme